MHSRCTRTEKERSLRSRWTEWSRRREGGRLHSGRQIDGGVRGGDGLPCEGGKWKKRDMEDGDKLDLVRARAGGRHQSLGELLVRTRSNSRRWGSKLDAYSFSRRPLRKLAIFFTTTTQGTFLALHSSSGLVGVAFW